MSNKIIVQGIEINDEDIKILKYIRENHMDLEEIKQAFEDSESLYDQMDEDYIDGLKY